MAELLTIAPEDGRDESVIAALESAMDAAKDGRVAAVGIALVYRDGVAGAKWTPGGSFIRLLGAIDRLRHKINLEADDPE